MFFFFSNQNPVWSISQAEVYFFFVVFVQKNGRVCCDGSCTLLRPKRVLNISYVIGVGALQGLPIEQVLDEYSLS